MSSRAIALTLLTCFVHICVGKFDMPPVTFEALSPRGFRVSIPDVEGVTLFGFHGSPFSWMSSPQVGLWARDVTKPTNGRWTYTNHYADLMMGDKIYYWTYIVYDGVGYRQEDGVWTVKVFVMNDDTAEVSDLEERMVNKGSQQTPPDILPTHQTYGATPPGQEINECKKTVTEIRGNKKICSGELLFESDFNTERSINGKWNTEVVFPEGPNYPFVVYMKGDHISLKNGHLAIKPILLEEKFGKGYTRKSLELKECTSDISTQCNKKAFGSQILPPVISGKLTTKQSFSFKYGRVEVEAKLPKGNWILSEILLEPLERKYGLSNSASGIIKIASVKGNDDFSNELNGGVVVNDRPLSYDFGVLVKNGQQSWNDDFHNYTLVWTPDQISLHVDGESYGSVIGTESISEIGMRENIEAASQWATGTKIAPFDEMFYISLDLRVGGVNDFWDSNSKPWENKSSKAIVKFWNSRSGWENTWSGGRSELLVKSVRVYAL